ncbi:receptor-type tyrosine-protein phosphatase epsilon-like isoform X2 [Mizuhopecten yessoensis]|uniref:receptor-type tyrosine-protein phosphatase epsilon-like isoform X2 n=1 Tax=Mizuhopecten yessoensis TaxID=6573 RepID=UPI000B45D6F6|nr:receptor-type tyrosine-protein phosphatase epsilon-like isoform X2 [Mizuhopecten yessoensis]
MGFCRYLLVSWSVVWTLTVVNASVNIASGKATNQSSVLHNWDSSKAVDGCKSTYMTSDCCTHTAQGQTEAWWQVDLQTQSVIDSVNIIYRDENNLARFAGYEIFLSNTQDWTLGTRCHKDTTAELGSMAVTQYITCPGVSRYLTIYNDRREEAKTWYSTDAILELCEVQVYGCQVGKYGNGNCNNDCLNCLGNMCDATSGTCDDCAAGYYKVSEICSPCASNCAGKKCEGLTGACIDGCTTGFSGTWCRCPVNCNDTSCPNYQCTDCSDGFYGPTCIRCPIGCSADTCNTTSGHCFRCTSGSYGNTCNQTCPSNCKNDICEQLNGECTECVQGFHGSVCSQACQTNCKINICNMQDGVCIECDPGLHGSDCSQACPTNCKNNICNMQDGVCIETEALTETTNTKVGTYAGAVVGVVVVIAFVIIVVVIVLRRRTLQTKQHAEYDDDPKNTSSLPLATSGRKSHKTSKTAMPVTNDKTIEYINVCDVGKKDEEVVYSNMYTSGGVSIDDIRAMIPQKLENEEEEFKKEFKELPWGAVHPHLVGAKASNKPKNRFKTTFPYDHSRVILDKIGNDPDSTYINANYIDSTDTRQAYVACQGPKEKTVDDFWRMVWQLNTGKIVMVTNLTEGGNVKCHQYWPDEGKPLSTKHLNISLDRERTYAFYILREISVTHRKTKKERQVHQFHFTTWPDHGTPDTLELVLFHRRVTSYRTHLTGQMVVHCSAGLGRTGTFIGLDALSKEEKKSGQVDISSYIRKMRENRMNMVQTHEQYIALHELLVQKHDLQDTLISDTDFPVTLRKMLPPGKPTNQTKLRKEFENLQTLIPKYDSSCYRAGMMKENKSKNRTMSIKAVDMYRAYLRSQVGDRNDYINAVMLQSHRSKSGYLMTQFPLEGTVDDLWTMVIDYNCENIVVLGTPTEHWLREESEANEAHGIYLRKQNALAVIPDVDIADYNIKSKRSKTDMTIRIFTMKEWSSDSLLPPSNSSLLLLLEQLDSRRQSDNTKPVVVMCQDGCTQSGLFCCISNARDQMKMDNEVDIFQTSRQIQVRRPPALRHIEQYQYCYNFIGQYLDSTNIYIN